jgi:hypothetical protein
MRSAGCTEALLQNLRSSSVKAQDVVFTEQAAQFELVNTRVVDVAHERTTLQGKGLLQRVALNLFSRQTGRVVRSHSPPSTTSHVALCRRDMTALRT